jgi:hypothetical protein
LFDKLDKIDFVSFESSGTYSANGQVAGTTSVQDLKDKSLHNGLCVNSPGWIIIELNKEWEFDEIEIGGWGGNSTIWSLYNGRGASILTSTDKTNWQTVGSIPKNYSQHVQTVKLTRTRAKYIKFNHNDYPGISFLKIV